MDHQYASDPTKGRWEVLARGMGQCANLGLALLLLPVARTSIIAEAFGLAWEQLLWVHIWVGYATLLLFVVHALCWYMVYAALHIFPEDVLEIPMYYPTNGQPKSNGRCSDDWTVPLATITTFLALIFLGVLSHHQVRRNHFELFYYAHHFFVAVYAVALWHAASCWYLVVGSLVRAFADRMVRLHEAGSRWRVVALEPRFDGVVHLELALRDGAFAFEADGEKPRDAWGEADVHQGIPFTHGRPDVSREIADLAACSSPYVFVCGPPGLSAACSAAALEHDVAFHSEVFAF